jgi:excisionase family DNA binding protein
MIAAYTSQPTPQSHPQLEPLAVSPKEAQRLLCISNTLFYELLKKKRIDTFLVGRKRLVKFDSLKRFAAGQAAA